MPNILSDDAKDKLYEDRIRDKNISPEMLILELYVDQRERQQNTINQNDIKKYSFCFYGSNDILFYLINYGVNSLHDGEPEKTVLQGELVRTREIGGKIFISFQIAEVEYEDSFFVEDIIKDARKFHSSYSDISDENWLQKKDKKGKEFENYRKMAEYAHDLAVEYNGVEYFFRDLQRDYYTYGEDAIVKYFENGKVSLPKEYLNTKKKKKYGALTRKVKELILRYNCIRHRTVQNKIRERMIAELKKNGFDTITDATLRTILQREGYSTEKKRIK